MMPPPGYESLPINSQNQPLIPVKSKKQIRYGLIGWYAFIHALTKPHEGFPPGATCLYVPNYDNPATRPLSITKLRFLM